MADQFAQLAADQTFTGLSTFQRVKQSINAETLVANKTLVVTDYIAQWLDLGGADRNVTLPAEASSANLMFIILNTADGAGEDLLVYDDTPTLVATLGAGMSGIFSCNGTAWKWENESGGYYDKISGYTLTRDVANGVAGLDSSGNVLAKAEAVKLTRDGANKIVIYERTSGESPVIFIRTGAEIYTGSILESVGVYSQIQTASMKDLASGIASLGSDKALIGSAISNQQSNGASFDILGLCTNPVFFNLLCEDPSAGTMTDISGAGHNGTYYGTMTAGDRVNKGSGWAVDYDGTDDYVSLGDSDDFSFAAADVDGAFTIFGAIQVVNAANNQMIISKYDESTGVELREWAVYLTPTETLRMLLIDESANVTPYRTTDAALSVGWHTFVITCSSASAGASRANDILIYVDGAVVASTATNDASYVAMENLAVPCWIGASEGTDGNPTYLMTGDMTGIGIEKGYVWSAMDVRRFHLKMKALLNL